MEPTVLILLLIIISILTINRPSYLQGNSKAASQKALESIKTGSFLGQEEFCSMLVKDFCGAVLVLGAVLINRITMVIIKMQYICMIY